MQVPVTGPAGTKKLEQVKELNYLWIMEGNTCCFSYLLLYKYYYNNNKYYYLFIIVNMFNSCICKMHETNN